LVTEAAAGFRSRRGLSYDDPAPVTPHNAPFPTYKAARLHHAARRRGGRLAGRDASAATGEGGDHRILSSLSQAAQSTWTAAFIQRMREHGWIEDRTVVIEYRWAQGRRERFAEIATEWRRDEREPRTDISQVQLQLHGLRDAPRRGVHQLRREDRGADP